jgi:glycosyltransferase involved in cell wall biosynthesis
MLPPNAPRTPSAIPQIAVIVPAYGVAHLLAEALDSLLAQEFSDWEAIVIDDGAPDDVAGAVKPYLADHRIRFVSTANHGVSAARNYAIKQTQAPLIALLDGDDLFRPTYLKTMVAAMDADHDAVICTCNARIFGVVPFETLTIPKDRKLSETATALDLLDNSFNVYIGSTFRREDWEKIGGFDPNMTHAEDLDFWIRLLLLGGHARYIDAVLGDYRVRGNSASANNLALIMGRIQLLEKVVIAYPESPEAAKAQERLKKEHAKAKLEEAIVATIAGDIRGGLLALRSQRDQLSGIVWTLSFGLWRIFPRLAPPMLAWRRRRHTRSVAAGEFLLTQGANVP